MTSWPVQSFSIPGKRVMVEPKKQWTPLILLDFFFFFWDRYLGQNLCFWL